MLNKSFSKDLTRQLQDFISIYSAVVALFCAPILIVASLQHFVKQLSYFATSYEKRNGIMKTVFIPVLTFPINSYCIALRSTNPSSFSYDFRSRSFYDCNINLEGEAIKSVGNTLIICKVQLTLCGIRSTGVGVFLFAHLQMNEPNIKYSRCNNTMAWCWRLM